MGNAIQPQRQGPDREEEADRRPGTLVGLADPPDLVREADRRTEAADVERAASEGGRRKALQGPGMVYRCRTAGVGRERVEYMQEGFRVQEWTWKGLMLEHLQ